MAARIQENIPEPELLDFCWRLCGDNATRSYPLFAAKAELAQEYARTAAHPGAFQAGCYQHGLLTGAVFGYADADERYLQTIGFFVTEGKSDLAELLLVWLSETFTGYRIHIGLPRENVTLAAALRRQNYRLIDDSLDLRLSKKRFSAAPPGLHQVFCVTPETLQTYLPFHQRHFGDCYWNAQRLENRFADWRVYALETDAAVSGGLFLRVYAGDAAEIYGLHAGNPSAASALLSRAAADLFLAGSPVTTVLFMTGTDEICAADAALSLGFRLENHYQCYEKKR